MNKEWNVYYIKQWFYIVLQVSKNGNCWCLCAVDIIEPFSLSSFPRIYWATIKRRNKQLIAICKQLKLTAKDGKNNVNRYYNNLKRRISMMRLLCI